MSSTTLTIDQLRMSPFNVRTSTPDAEKDAEMEASILSEGQHNPIIVHPMAGAKGKWGALGGGRRYRAFDALIKRGALQASQPIKATIVDATAPADLLEISITENLIRLDLKDHELFAAIARCAANGHDADQIAANLGGKNPQLVARWLRLGRLAKPVFDAFAAGLVTLELATAYAATEDQALQVATFARLSEGHPYAHTAAAVRLAMKVGDREAGKLLAFVGEDAYRAAGGRFELDLFAEEPEQRGRIVDEPILQTLVEAKLSEIRDEVRVTTARCDLRFIPKPPQTDYNTDDWQLQVTAPRSGTGAGSLQLPDGDVVAHIAIDADGEPTIGFWWASRKAKFGGGKKPPVTTSLPGPAPRIDAGQAIDNRSGTKAAADAAIKQEAGIGQDAVQILRSVRRAILRALLASDADRGGTAAIDYLVWSQLRMLVGGEVSSRIGIQRVPTETIGGFDLAQRARAQIEASGTAGAVNEALRELNQQSFFTNPDLGQAYLAYRASPQRLKNLAAAIVAGFALERSLAAPGYDLPIHDVLAQQVDGEDGVAVRDHWTPTAELLGLHPREQRLALARDLVDEATLRRWSALRTDQLTDAVLGAVNAQPDWVHPLLRFGQAAGESAAAGRELQEAAE